MRPTPCPERPGPLQQGGDGACGGGCFLAGTKITMADKTEKPIEEFQVSDMVLAYDEKTGELKPDRVSVVHEPVMRRRISSSTTRCT